MSTDTETAQVPVTYVAGEESWSRCAVTRLPPISRRTVLPAVLRHCTVHNTLRRAPEIIIGLDEVRS